MDWLMKKNSTHNAITQGLNDAIKMSIFLKVMYDHRHHSHVTSVSKTAVHTLPRLQAALNKRFDVTVVILRSMYDSRTQ